MGVICYTLYSIHFQQCDRRVHHASDRNQYSDNSEGLDYSHIACIGSEPHRGASDFNNESIANLLLAISKAL
jgi:hypothetical protein